MPFEVTAAGRPRDRRLSAPGAPGADRPWGPTGRIDWGELARGSFVSASAASVHSTMLIEIAPSQQTASSTPTKREKQAGTDPC